MLTIDSTFKRGNLEVDLAGVESLLQVSAKEKADEIFTHFEQKVWPIVPESLKAKLDARKIRISFEKGLVKAAIFYDNASFSEPLQIKVRDTLVNDPFFLRVLSHEWFHALHFVVHKDEPSWLREGLAQVFEHMVMGGYNGQKLLRALEKSESRLDFDFNANLNKVVDEAYGHVFLYFFYLYQKCGKNELFWRLVESSEKVFGVNSIELALTQGKDLPAYCKNFKDSVVQAELARFHNRQVKQDGKYTDDYLIVPELSRKVAGVIQATQVDAKMLELATYYPFIFSADSQKPLMKYQKNPNLVFYTLGQSSPYSVRKGLVVDANASPADLIFAIKLK